MQLLINRSIVLGTWERPQLHDIVREYVISLHSPEELMRLQRKVVDAFTEHRPVSSDPAMCGLRIWPAKGNSLHNYLVVSNLRMLTYHWRLHNTLAVNHCTQATGPGRIYQRSCDSTTIKCRIITVR